MILKNFNIWKKLYLTANVQSGQLTIPAMKDITGTDYNTAYYVDDSYARFEPRLLINDNANYNQQFDYGQQGILWIGSNDTAPTIDDYELSGAFTSSQISTAVYTVDRSVSGDSISLVFKRTFQNISGADIVVREIGFAKCLRVDSSTYKQFLLSRDVLETPITVAPNEYITVNFVITV